VRFVIDASVAASWAFDDEESLVADATLERISHDDAIAPSLWWFEVRNTLIVGERRGRLSIADTSAFLRQLAEIDVKIDDSPDDMAIMALARQHRLTVYDASYLELAQREGLPLATLDTALRKAATALGVELIDSMS
jgi:predicted nucleic acid-binding protein